MRRWGDQQRYDIKSATKSFGATMLGIALKDGKPSKAYAPADPKHEALPVTNEANGHLTKVDMPANAPDSRNTEIAVITEDE